jgi:hypothetical protein
MTDFLDDDEHVALKADGFDEAILGFGASGHLLATLSMTVTAALQYLLSVTV